MCVSMGVGVGCAWRSENNNLRELVLPFHRDHTQVPRVGCKHLYMLSHLTGPVDLHFHIYRHRLL